MEPQCENGNLSQLELRAVYLALKISLSFLSHHHVLVHSDNVLMVRYINCQGIIRSDGALHLAQKLLKWAHT